MKDLSQMAMKLSKSIQLKQLYATNQNLFMDISCYSSNLYIVMTLLSSKLYNILTSDFSFFMFPSNAIPIKVGCTLNAIFDPLTKAVNIIFPNILQPSYLVLVLHESQITSFLSNCSTFPLHFGQTIFSLKESNFVCNFSMI